MSVVAALFVDPAGVYAGIPGVEVWDEARDARGYAGPWPVVAHPPCNRWVSYGDRAKRGKDGGCFESALTSVRMFGGVLEHPARSQAWRYFDLPRPAPGVWRKMLDDPGWVTEVDQFAYGFPTRKVTWLYAVGQTSPSTSVRQALAPQGWRGCDSLWSTERSKTPADFRDALLAMARTAATALPAAEPHPESLA